jgi:hypothetical protein
MKIDDDLILLDGMPIAYIKSLKALIIADMHLGYEGVMAKKGILLPKMNLKSIKDMLSKAIRDTGATNLIVDGDIKNEFSTVDQEEFNELFDFIGFIRSNNVNLTLIKGNHDNFVERYRDSFGIKVFSQATKMGKYLFFHGEELPLAEKGAKMYIMGHEHPAIGFYNTGGTKEKIPCFLYGRWRKGRLLVLPAINYFAGGTDVNLQPKEKLLSPVFKSVDLNKMHAIAVGHGSTIDFGPVSKLRKLAHSEI